MSDDHEEMPNYYDMQGGDMLKALGDNGQLWAQAFIQIIDRIGRDKIDEGFMLGWFANAIEHSNAVRRWAREAASALADAPGDVSGQAPDLSRTPPALAHGEALARIVRLEAALRKAYTELNTIRAADGVPYTAVSGIISKSSVDEQYFSDVVDECRAALADAPGEGT